jgi:hypothetical protein
MENNTPANPEPEIEQALGAEPEATETETEIIEADDKPIEEAGEEFEDFEIDGKVLKVSKEAKPYLMMDRDYRQKTMALSERERGFEAEREEFQRTAESQKAFIDTVVAVQRMDQELADLQTIDFETLAVENPQEANRLWFRMQQLRDERNNAAGHAQNLSQQQAEANERARVNAQQKALAELSTPKPELGWAGKFDPEVSQTLTKAGIELGFAADELSRVDDPRIIRTLNLARIGLQALKKQSAASPAATAPKAAPVPQVGGSKARVAAKDPERMSPEEFRKWRDEQEFGNRARR